MADMSTAQAINTLAVKMRELGLFPQAPPAGAAAQGPLVHGPAPPPPPQQQQSYPYPNPYSSADPSGLAAALLSMGLAAEPPPAGADAAAPGRREDLLASLVQTMLGDLNEEDIKRVLTNVVNDQPPPGRGLPFGPIDMFSSDYSSAAAALIGGAAAGLGTAAETTNVQAHANNFAAQRSNALEEQFSRHLAGMKVERAAMQQRLEAALACATSTPQQLAHMFCVSRSKVLSMARQHTTCASCLHSVRTLRLKDHPLVEDDGEMFRLRSVHLQSVRTTAKALAVYEGSGTWMTRLRPPGRKKSSRCRAHASFRKHVDQQEWRTVWDSAPDEFKIGIASMLPSELSQSAKTHLTSVGFCKHCSANVMEGFKLLLATAEPDFCPPADYDHMVYDPLHVIKVRRRHRQRCTGCHCCTAAHPFAVIMSPCVFSPTFPTTTITY